MKFGKGSVLVFLALFAVTLSGASGGASMPSGHVGGVVRIPLPSPATQAVFNGKRQLLMGNLVIVGVPLETKVGQHTLEYSTAQSNGQIEFLIEDRNYPESHITISDPQMVTPSETDLARINKETALMKAVYARHSAYPANLYPVIAPAEGRVSDVFGSRRFFNGETRRPHSGIDYAAPIGTPVHAPAPGEVAVTGDFYFNGKTILIDHGGGFVSMMCHMNAITVSQGEFIERKTIIGTIGTTGRSTGPHLHWSVSLQGDRVDPTVFLEAVNSATSDVE